jgi:hypothetical protein
VNKPRLSATAIAIRVIIVGLALSLFFPQAGALSLLHLEGSGASVMLTPVYWVSLLAPVFFLAALKVASDAIVRMDRGDDFGPAVVRGLRETGFCLMLGAFAAAVVQPSLIFLIGNGFSEMRGVEFDYTVENVTLALVGLVLLLIARQGQQLKSKLDEFV